MNNCIAGLFSAPDRVAHFVKGLPLAFGTVAETMGKSNPAVGVLREHILIGYFMSEFGRGQVGISPEGNKRGHDVVVCGDRLSIKTITGSGAVKILWTVDQTSVEKEMEGGYFPDVDLFLVSINWGKYCDSVFYIPASVQSNVCSDMGGVNHYLDVQTGTNHRGISISSKAMKSLKKHSETMKLAVNWSKPAEIESPYKKWEEFWKNLQSQEMGGG